MNTFKRERLIWTNPWVFVACGFGIGTLPIMPGTYATFASAFFCLLLMKLSMFYYVIITVVANVVGVWLCGEANRIFGTDDHPAAVWDEIGAFLIVMIGVPFTWYYILLGIALFRFFDIYKPGPIRWVENNIKGGMGVMLDDILAALASWIILQGVIFIFP